MAHRVARFAVRIALGFATLMSVGSAGADNSVVYEDLASPAPGVPADAPNITTVTVSNNNDGLVTFRIAIPNRPTLTSGLELYLGFNADELPTDSRECNKEYFETCNPDGLDHAVYVSGQSGSAELFTTYEWFNWAAVPNSSLKFSYVNGAVTIEINKADLSNADHFGFRVLALEGWADAAPDFSLWAYDVKMLTRLNVVTFKTSQARAGKLFTVSLSATRDDTGRPPVAGGAKAECRVILGKKPLRLRRRTLSADGIATCLWLLPKAAKGKVLKGEISIFLAGSKALPAIKTFSFKVR